MRYPKFLPKGGAIGCVAPSFGCSIEPYRTAFDNALKKWKEMGYGLVLGPNCYADKGVGISNSPEKCGQEVMDMFLSGEADCLISCGGGELMCEILPYVDFKKLSEAEPKWFMGYSDNTNLTYLLATLSDTASVYGPNAPAFGMEPQHPSLFDAMSILTGEQRVVKGYGMWEQESVKNPENPLQPYHLTEPRAIRSFVGLEEITWGGKPGRERRFVEGESSVEGKHSMEGEPSAKGKHFMEGEHSVEGQLSAKGKLFMGEPSAEGKLSMEGEPSTEGKHSMKKEPSVEESSAEPLRFQGRLLGGCMDCLVNLLGTRFDRTREFVERYKEDGILWFLEACDLNVFAIRRAMWQMEEAGWFRYAKGFLIGRPLNGAPMMGLDVYQAVLETAGRKNVPVIMDVDLGHLPPMMPLVTGSIGEAVVRGNEMRYA